MKANKKSISTLYLIAGGGAILFLGVATAIASVFPPLHTIVPGSTITFTRPNAATTTMPLKPVVEHVSTPSAVRAIYMSQCVVGTPDFRNSLVKFIDTSDINAVVVDIRDYTGRISFPTKNPVLRDMVSKQCGALDMRAFIKSLHEKNIYVIGRITTFQNPYYTSQHPKEAVQKRCAQKGATSTCGVWKDYKGLAFVDVGAKPYWDTVVELGKVAHDEMGFDELNFDYVRFPSDGPMAEAVYTWSRTKTKAEALEAFFKYLSEKLEPTKAVLSADLFGMTATNYDDLNIGQVLERALPYFDYIDPMVYPSHYPKNFNGYANVNAHSYDIVNLSMNTAVARALAPTTTIASLAYTPIASTSPQAYTKPKYPASAIRPWLQSFDYPVTYTPEMVAAQIKANEDAGLDSYLFWDAANKYRSLREVMKEKAIQAPVAKSSN